MPSFVCPPYCFGASTAADAGEAQSRIVSRAMGATSRCKGAAEGSETDEVPSSLFANCDGVPRTGQTTRLAAQKRLVFEPVWLIGLGTQPRSPVLLVLVVGAFEPDDLRVALEGEHVRRDPVEEPAIVGDDDGAAGEVDERVLERAQRVD